MLAGGGRALEDLRTLKGDTALSSLLQQTVLPSTDAVGDWLRRAGAGAGAGLGGLSRLNRRIVAARIRQTGQTGHTLDGDASQIVAEKEAAQFTYKGEQGYMPMIGHLAETLHSMNDTEKAFRLIVVKYRHQGELFDDKPRYHVIASNRAESTAATPVWDRQRGEVSENGIKELKNGFGMERMPCGQFAANAAFFRIGAIAHNLFVLFEHSALGEGWQRHKVATVRWRLFQLPGKVVHHAGALVLKIATGFVELFREIRSKSKQFAQAFAP